MKRIYYFFVNSGKVLFIWTIMLVLSISLQSLTTRGKVNYGGRCYQNFDDSFVKNYNYDGIELNYSKLECNTYYIEYNSVLEEKQNLIFLVSLSKLFYDNQINADIHVIIKSEKYQMISTIVDYQVSYTKSLI